MNSKVEFWLIRTVVVAYGLACLIAVVCNNTNIDMKADICESCGDTQQKNGMLIWLKELQAEGEDMSPYNYEVTEAIPLTAEQLAVILAPDNFREQGDIMAMAEFMPIAQARYTNANGQEEILAFSFVSCEYKKYINGIIIEKGLLGKPDALSEFLESIH